MKIYKTQEEVEKDIEGSMLIVNESVTFECSIKIEASLKVKGDISAGDISAGDISARDISAGDISAGNINARDIKAGDINARDINAWDISARDINAWDISARDILYYAFCCVYNSITCFSIKGKRIKCAKPIVIDGKIEIKKKEVKQ